MDIPVDVAGIEAVEQVGRAQTYRHALAENDRYLFLDGEICGKEIRHGVAVVWTYKVTELIYSRKRKTGTHFYRKRSR